MKGLRKAIIAHRTMGEEERHVVLITTTTKIAVKSERLVVHPENKDPERDVTHLISMYSRAHHRRGSNSQDLQKGFAGSTL